MQCTACGRENPDDARFCAGCGTRLAREVTCAHCGKENPSDASFCVECGSEISATGAPATSVDRSTAQPQPTSFASSRYEVKRFLGEGGKKRVYLAHDAQLDRDVAFALIKTEGLDDAARVRITREAQAMGRLGSHPHIVTVYDIGEENGQPYLVLPVLPGGDVEGIIEDAPDHKLSIEQAVKIASETCMGLEFSHQKGIIHRDLKPGNVWLAEDGRAMIGDFGLAVAVDRSRLTQAGMMVGTVSYMPPEQAMGGEVTPQSDLYSLGAMLYEMVCGRPPFVGDESVAIIGQHLNTPPVAPSWHRPDCPPGLEALILRLLEKDATKRPASASEVKEALASVDLNTVGAPSESTEAPHEHGPLYHRIFVGRENELRQLQQAFDVAMSGQGGLVMLVGEPGIGKTALCEQIATYASLRGGQTLVGHCYEEGSLSLPYLAFIEALRGYVRSHDRDVLQKELGSMAPHIARILSEIRERVQVPEIEPASPEEERYQLLQGVSEFLSNAAAARPMLIVLEDLHWADRGTLDLLLHLSRNLQGARILVLGTYRDVDLERSSPLSSTLAELRRIESFQRITLRGLGEGEIQRLLTMAHSQSLAPDQAALVYRQTEGNPLFVQETLRYLVEGGLVVSRNGRYVGASEFVLESVMPEGLREVIGKRLNLLSAQCNTVLSTAAVIGRDFRLSTLQAVAGVSEEELLTAIEEAVHASILEEHPSLGTVQYRFVHAFFRTALYEELVAPRRIRLHREIANVLETEFSTRQSEHAAEFAYHFGHSSDRGDLVKAVSYGREAAHHATSVYAFGEAVHQLERALQVQQALDPNDGNARCELLLDLSAALLDADEPSRMEAEVAEEAFNLAVHDGNSNQAARAAVSGLLALTPFYRQRRRAPATLPRMVCPRGSVCRGRIRGARNDRRGLGRL